jgi:hypothetical protein
MQYISHGVPVTEWCAQFRAIKVVGRLGGWWGIFVASYWYVHGLHVCGSLMHGECCRLCARWGIFVASYRYVHGHRVCGSLMHGECCRLCARWGIFVASYRYVHGHRVYGSLMHGECCRLSTRGLICDKCYYCFHTFPYRVVRQLFTRHP